MIKMLLLNGPNLNMLGKRDVHFYGTETLKEIEQRTVAQATEWDVELVCHQSNHEGELIDWIQQAAGQYQAVIFNPGAYAHYSLALRDAIEDLPIPVIEVHMSNVAVREEFRQHSVIAPVCLGQISGLGAQGYSLAVLGARNFLLTEAR